jgi:putative addiction module CopG family antidote
MQTMNISLPDPMKQYVEEQVSAGSYSSASEYVRELVRAEPRQRPAGADTAQCHQFRGPHRRYTRIGRGGTTKA